MDFLIVAIVIFLILFLKMFEACDFIAELTHSTNSVQAPHIPPKYKHYIRYYGLYSGRGKAAAGKEKKLEHLFPEEFVKTEETERLHPENYEEPADRKKQKNVWARLIQKVFEVDPLVCSHCGCEMKITSFIFDSDSLERIVEWIEKQKAKPPPELVSAC